MQAPCFKTNKGKKRSQSTMTGICSKLSSPKITRLFPSHIPSTMRKLNLISKNKLNLKVNFSFCLTENRLPPDLLNLSIYYSNKQCKKWTSLGFYWWAKCLVETPGSFNLHSSWFFAYLGFILLSPVYRPRTTMFTTITLKYSDMRRMFSFWLDIPVYLYLYLIIYISITK